MRIGDPDCTKCKLHETTDRVCVIPPIKQSEIMIVGEAPGATEEREGKVFAGQAGKYLVQIMNKCGLEREDTFIGNAVNCRPPENRTPKKGEIKACRYWMQKQLNRVKPKYVLILGNVPLESLLDLKGIKKFRGKPIERDGIIYMPTYHPAYVLRDPTAADAFETDMRLFVEICNTGKIPSEEGLNMQVGNDQAFLDRVLDDLWGACSLDIETNGLYPWGPGMRINSLGFGTAKAQWIVPAMHEYSKLTKAQLTKFLEEIERRVDEGELKLTMQNGKFDALWIYIHYGVLLEIEFDTMLAHFLCNENSLHGLKYLSQIYFGAIDYDIDTPTKLGEKGFEPLAFYQAHDLYYTRKLRFILLKELKKDEQVYEVFRKIMMPCANLFVEIEARGVFINTDQFDEAEEYLTNAKATAERSLKKWTKHDPEFNWGSTKQVGELLFGKLKIKAVEKTKGGKPSTSESVIKQIDHPIREDLLAFRAAKQQLSFFIEGWKPYIINGRLHPSFKLHGTVTGRLSCENPNLQQVPRDPRIRTLITAPKGWSLMEADLSQIELRIAAELSGDRGLIFAFQNNIDPHWYTCVNEIKRAGAMKDTVLKTATVWSKKKVTNFGEACDMLIKMGNKAAEKIDPEWKELRKKAKAINFGFLYGMWWKKFKIYALDNYGVRVTDQQAQQSRELYFETYPDLQPWHVRQKKFARTNGYVRSLSGRLRRLPEAMSRHDTPARGSAERQAINSPVQSFANELNLMAAIQMRAEFPRSVFHIVGTVHDALLMEVRDDYVERVYKRVLEIMSGPQLLEDMNITLRVPIEAEAKIGAWGAGVSIEEWKEKRK